MSPTLEVPLPERILDAAERVLRRHGAEKTNVVDIARVLGMSHGNIYRHFPSKKALLDAVASRWLHKVTSPLQAIANDRTCSASDRLVRWFDTLRTVKQHKVLDDPELFRVYHRLAVAAGELVREHVDDLLAQVEQIITDGMAAGDFSDRLKPRSARPVLHARDVFLSPSGSAIAGDAPRGRGCPGHLLAMLLAGLRAGVPPLPAFSHP